MITNIKKIRLLFVILCSQLILSCSKDNDTPIVIPVTPVVYEEQNPLEGYLTATGFLTRNNGSSASAEFGFSFKPLTNGNITAIVARIPLANPNLRVTIWDKSGAGTILKTEYLNITAGDTEIVKTITPLQLTANTEYMISFNSTSWYDHRSSPMTYVNYPFTVGDIKITAYGFADGSAQTIPYLFPRNVYKGDVSFKFLKS